MKWDFVLALAVVVILAIAVIVWAWPYSVISIGLFCTLLFGWMCMIRVFHGVWPKVFGRPKP